MTFPACSLHNHTTWSDGQSSVQEMVEEAARIGLREVGISDHFTHSPGGRAVQWSMHPEQLNEYVEDVRSAQGTAEPVVRLGVEADFFPETVTEVRRRLAEFEFDYVIGSVHFVGQFPVDSRADDWSSLSMENVTGIWREYWELVRRMAESRVFDIAAHLDLPKKFAFLPHQNLEREETAALTAIAQSGMAIEINTNGWNMPAAEAYPSLRLLKKARGLGIPLLINSDAHRPQRLVEGFGRARELAREAGYTELARYELRRRTRLPL